MMRNKSIAIIAAAFSAVLLSSSAASSYPFGDEPYWLDWGPTSLPIQPECVRWNWQQYHWDNLCPVYVHPKAFMYPRASRAALRTRGRAQSRVSPPSGFASHRKTEIFAQECAML